MPVGAYLANGTEVGSSSRKRSHAQITRSESRSVSPDLPSKRRRTTLSSSATPSIIHYQSSLPVHTERDGFDYRRPIMASGNLYGHETIDLTAEDDSPPPTTHFTALAPRRASSTPVRAISQDTASRHQVARPFGNSHASGQQTVIDLSAADDDEDERHVQRPRLPQVHRVSSSSPDLEITLERPAQAPLPNRQASRHPSSPQTAGRGALASFLTRGIRIFRGANDAVRIDENVIDDGMLDRIDGLPGRLGLVPPPAGDDLLVDVGGDLEINLDYGRPAFALGGMVDRSSATPHMGGHDYKSPGAAKEGFTRNYGEQDVLVCPLCSEELSTGDTETKQQVWVSKSCGHVYCGTCASNRVIGKAGNKRDCKKGANRKTLQFKKCQVDGCEKVLSAKTAMFPIYL